MKYSVFSIAYYPFLRGIRFSMVGSSPKIISKLSYESKNFKDLVKVMASPDSTIGQTWSIFRVREVDCATGRGDWGVDKRLDGAINWICGEGDNVIVSRTLITSLSNLSGSMPERISSNKLPRVNTIFSTGWVGAGTTEGEVDIESGVAVDGRVEELRVCGKRKENLRAKDFLGAQKPTVLAETLELKVKCEISARRLLVSGTLIGFSEESEKGTLIRFDTWKRAKDRLSGYFGLTFRGTRINIEISRDCSHETIKRNGRRIG